MPKKHNVQYRLYRDKKILTITGIYTDQHQLGFILSFLHQQNIKLTVKSPWLSKYGTLK